MKIMKSLLGVAALSMGLAAGSAQAVFINGSMGVSDGILGTSLPAGASTSVVSALSQIVHEASIATGCTGTFATEASCTPPTGASMTTWSFGGPFPVNIITVDGFTFQLTGATQTSNVALSCNAATGTCGDSRSFSLIGFVSGNGYDTTAFTGTLTLSGSCVGAGNACTGQQAGTFAYALSATGRPNLVPEPGTLALLGIALSALGFTVRRRK